MNKYLLLIPVILIIIAIPLTFTALVTNPQGIIEGSNKSSHHSAEILENKLENYPDFFLNKGKLDVVIIIDEFPNQADIDAAGMLSESLGKQYNTKVPIIRYNELESLYDHNAIFVGTCNTTPYNKFVNIYLDCLSAPRDAGQIKLAPRTKGVTRIYAVGYNPEHTLAVAEMLSNYEQYNLSDMWWEVRRQDGNIVVRWVK